MNFIEKAKEVHGDKYDYSKVEYVNSKTKVCIICPIHGEFWQREDNHLANHGCPKCGKKSFVIDINDFIRESNIVHKEKYIYNKSVFKDRNTKLTITCPIHGDFEQKPQKHLHGQGCPNCCSNLKWNQEVFLEKAKSVHNDNYDYSKSNYINFSTKVCIICKEHGEFWQAPSKHINRKQGCPICAQYKLVNENRLFEELRNEFKDLEIIRQQKFDWLGLQSLDFFIPQYNIAIEYQGEQHFEPIKHFGGEEKYERTKKLDLLKHQKCLENNVKLFYFTYIKKIPNNYIGDIYNSIDELLNKIKYYANNTRNR